MQAHDIIHYRQHLIRVERRQPATINRRLQALRRWCRWATHRGLFNSNPAAEIHMVPTSVPQQPLGLQEPEIHTLLLAAGESRHDLARRNYALVQLMIQTGLRVGEVASLLIADLGFGDQWILLANSVLESIPGNVGWVRHHD